MTTPKTVSEKWDTIIDILSDLRDIMRMFAAADGIQPQEKNRQTQPVLDRT